MVILSNESISCVIRGYIYRIIMTTICTTIVQICTMDVSCKGDQCHQHQHGNILPSSLSWQFATCSIAHAPEATRLLVPFPLGSPPQLYFLKTIIFMYKTQWCRGPVSCFFTNYRVSTYLFLSFWIWEALQTAYSYLLVVSIDRTCGVTNCIVDNKKYMSLTYQLLQSLNLVNLITITKRVQYLYNYNYTVFQIIYPPNLQNIYLFTLDNLKVQLNKQMRGEYIPRMG